MVVTLTNGKGQSVKRSAYVLIAYVLCGAQRDRTFGMLSHDEESIVGSAGDGYQVAVGQCRQVDRIVLVVGIGGCKGECLRTAIRLSNRHVIRCQGIATTRYVQSLGGRIRFPFEGFCAGRRHSKGDSSITFTYGTQFAVLVYDDGLVIGSNAHGHLIGVRRAECAG